MADKYNVPEDIILRILAKLPAKTLQQFRCVSKHWNLMILDPNFMKWRSRRMIFVSVYPFMAIDNNGPDGDSANLVLTLRSPPVLSKYRQYRRVAGTSNGIVLLVVFEDTNCDMILYNPLTAAIMNVPNPPHRPSNIYANAYGFGYGTIPDDLKIVIISEKQRWDQRSCDVFNFKTKSWNKPLELIGNYGIFAYKGVFANGFFYWNVSVTNENRICEGWALVALDVKEMVFTEHSVPRLTIYPLGTLKGRLCMICDDKNGGSLELWIMNKHGLQTSFSKVCKLPSLKGFLEYQSPTDHRMLYNRMMCILDGGKIVLLNYRTTNGTTELMIYDMLNDSYKTVTTIVNKSGYAYQAIEYVESCVSP